MTVDIGDFGTVEVYIRELGNRTVDIGDFGTVEVDIVEFGNVEVNIWDFGNMTVDIGDFGTVEVDEKTYRPRFRPNKALESLRLASPIAASSTS
jgi:hypothetical protein